MTTLEEAVIGTGVIALIISAWDQVKAVWVYLQSLIITTNYCDEDLGGTVVCYLLDRYRSHYSLGRPNFGVTTAFLKPLDKNHPVAYSIARWNVTLFFIGWKPILVAGNTDNSNDQSVSVSFFRWSVDWSKLVLDAVTWGSDQKDDDIVSNRFRVIRMFGSRHNKQSITINTAQTERAEKRESSSILVRKWGHDLMHWQWDDLGQSAVLCGIDVLSLSNDQLNLIQEIEHWRKLEDWCKERGVPWKRGFLFHGVPGTGKTALTRALGESLNCPVFSFDLTSMSNEDFIDNWKEALNNTPCIILMEDIDAVFCGRINVTGEEGVSFDCLINAIDGVQAVNGILTIITTNNVDKIDVALSAPGYDTGNSMPSRPGRIDRSVEFGPLTKEGRIKMAKRILDNANDIDRMVELGNNDTGAQFQERLVRKAMADRFDSWKPKENPQTP